MLEEYQGAHFALALLELRGIGKKTAADVISQAVSIPTTPADLVAAVHEFGGRKGDSIGEVEAVAAFDRAKRTLQDASDQGVTVFAICQSGYPANLRSIPDPPPVIFVRGNAGAGRSR